MQNFTENHDNKITFVEGLAATFMSESESLTIYHNGTKIFRISIFTDDGLDYWNTLTFGEDVYDINFHQYEGRLSLQMYPVIDNQVDGSIWQNIPLTVIDNKL